MTNVGVRLAVVALCVVMLGLYAQPFAQYGLPSVDVIVPDLGTFFGHVVDAMKSALGTFIGFFIGDASANNRYLVLDDALCNKNAIVGDIHCWSGSSGGPGGIAIPTTADTAIMDSLSGMPGDIGKLESNLGFWGNLQVTSGFAATIDFNGFNLYIVNSGVVTLYGVWYLRGGLFQINGTLDAHSATWNYNTAMVEFTGTGFVYLPGGCGGPRNVYDLKIDSGVTTTIVGCIGLDNQLTVNGRLDMNNGYVFVWTVAGISDPIVRGGGSNITSTGGFISFVNLAGTGVNIPGGVYWHVPFGFAPDVFVGGPGFGFAFVFTGDVLTDSWTLEYRNGLPFSVNTQSFNVTIVMSSSANCILDLPIGNDGTVHGIVSSGGTWNLYCTTSAVQAKASDGNVASFFWKMPTGGVYMHGGSWLTGGVTSSLNWVDGPLIMESPTIYGGKVTIPFDPPNFATWQFSNLTVKAACLPGCIGLVQLNNTAHPLWARNIYVVGDLATNRWGLLESRITEAQNGPSVSVPVHFGKVVLTPRGALYMAYSTWYGELAGSVCWDASTGVDQPPLGSTAGLSRVIWKANCGVSWSVIPVWNFWNWRIANGTTLTMLTDGIVQNVTEIGTGTGTAHLILGSHQLFSKSDWGREGPQPPSWTFNKTAASTVSCDGARGGFVFNSVNNNQSFNGGNFANCILYFESSGSLITGGLPNYQQLLGDATTTMPCYIYSFEDMVGRSSYHSLRLNGHTLTCAALNIGAIGFGPFIPSGIPFFDGTYGGHLVIHGNVTIGNVTHTAYVNFGSTTWSVDGQFTAYNLANFVMAQAPLITFTGTGTHQITLTGEGFVTNVTGTNVVWMFVNDRNKSDQPDFAGYNVTGSGTVVFNSTGYIPNTDYNFFIDGVKTSLFTGPAYTFTWSTWSIHSFTWNLYVSQTISDAITYYVWLFVFVAVIILMLYGAWWIKKRRGGL